MVSWAGIALAVIQVASGFLGGLLVLVAEGWVLLLGLVLLRAHQSDT